MSTFANRNLATATASRNPPSLTLHPGGKDEYTVDYSPVSLLDTLYALVKRGDIDGALDLIYERFDEMLGSERFAEIDALLSSANLDTLELATVIALLVVTAPARDQLSARESLGLRVQRWLERNGHSEDEIAGLL